MCAQYAHPTFVNHHSSRALRYVVVQTFFNGHIPPDMHFSIAHVSTFTSQNQQTVSFKSQQRTPQMNRNFASHSDSDAALPFIQFVYNSEGIAGVAELYRSVVVKPNSGRPVNSIDVST